MPQLSNPKHELFAALLAEGRSATEAHALAGYKPNRHNAWVLKQREDIQTRINELLAERAAQHAAATAQAVQELALSEEWVLGELKRNATKAAELKQYGPANRALELIGKQLGMFVDKSEILQKSEEFQGWTMEQMRTELVRSARELGLLEGPQDDGDHQDGDGELN